MASLNSMAIRFEIEPIVKLYCTEILCQFNMVRVGKNRCTCCNLKEIDIGAGGRCLNFTERIKQDPDSTE